MLAANYDIALAVWMLGVAVAHALRFWRFKDPKNRKIVAGAAVVIYMVAAVLSLTGPLWAAHAIALCFPVLGIITVTATGSEVDDWQIAVGVTQFAAIVYIIAKLLVAA